MRSRQNHNKSNNQKNHSPGIWFRLLKFICPTHLYEEIEGDLIQKLHNDRRLFGERRAKRRLIWNVVRFLRISILLRHKFDSIHDYNLIFHSHSKVIIRQIARNKTFSIVNIFGLVSGIFVCLLIAQYVWWEWSFDRHVENADNIYRINLYNAENGVFSNISSQTVSGLAHSIEQEIPGTKSIARLSSKTSAIVISKEKGLQNREDEMVFADPSIIEVLGLRIIEGDRKTALRDPKGIIISASATLKYFGTTQVAGQVLEVGFSGSTIQYNPYQIQGVFADIPANSHQQFQFVFSPENEQAWNENWAWSNVFTYIALPAEVKTKAFEAGLSNIVKQHHVDGTGDRYLLEPITDIRLHALDRSGKASIIKFFILLGVVILLLAWFNYINLSTARFFERMKEVGVRKLIGARRRQLVTQFLLESFFFNAISFVFALILFFLMWPIVAQILQQNIPLNLFKNPAVIGISIGFVFIGSLCTGFYPAIFLSSFRPLESLKGKISNYADRSTIRKIVIVAQLSVSVVLITAVLAIDQQIDFMSKQNLGIAIDQTLIVEAPLLTDATTVQKYETLKHRFLEIPNVNGVTYASSFPGAEIDWHRADITLGEENASFRYNSRIISIGNEFLDVFKLPLLKGRNFDPRIESDAKAMLINEEASKMFGFENYDASLGKVIFVGSRRFEVIGVVKNYHYRSLRNQVQPILYMQGYPRNPTYAIKISTEGIPGTISKIETRWKAAYSENAFKYYFLDDYFDRQYNSEREIEAIISGLTVLAILISCSGLFGLSLYAVSRRTKEIGIRKVLGASVSSVMLLLSRDVIKLTILGAVITIPMTYQGIQFWLEDYAYKMPMDPWMFTIPVVAIMFLTLMTISFQTMTAAKKNPVESLKYE